MAIIKSFSPFQNLSNFQTFLVDDNPLSDYFRITEFKDTFTGGKNGFLIEGSEFLKETTEVKIEVLDVNGNPIYFEPGDGIPEYYEGTSKLVSVHVYDDTPIGLGKITILGELKNYVDTNGSVIPVPSEWKGIYNVKWERTFKVNKNLNNEDSVRFYKRPLVNIDELVKPIFTKSVNQVTDVGEVSGVAQLPNIGTNLSTYRGGTFYKLIKSSGSWDVDVDENTIDVTIDGSIYSPKIIEVLNSREVLVDIPYTNNSIVSNFVSQSYSVTYTDFQNETIEESALTGSFAKIDITQLKTFIGDVARVKVFRKSRSSANDFQFVQESRLESTELLKDISENISDTELSYGRFDQTNLDTYWVTTSIDHPTEVDSSILSQAVKVDYNGSGVQKLITSQSFSISKDVEYTLNFRTLLSGSISDDKYLKAYFSGSYENGSPFTQSFVDVTPDGSYVVRKTITENVIAQQNIDAKLVFEFKGDDWYISNVSLKNAQDTSFSPDEFTLIQDIPRKLVSETFDFRFEFYDINNNYIPVNVIASKTFNGGNDFNTVSKLLTFESDRNAFRYSSGSANPDSQQIQFKVTKQNLTGSVEYDWKAYTQDGTELTESIEWIQYPGYLPNPNDAGALLSVSNFEGIYDTASYGPSPEVYSIIYTASLEDFQEFETVYRLEDGDNAPQLIVTSNANQFIYEPTTLSPKPSGQSITIRAQRKNLSLTNPGITVNSGSNLPYLTFVGTTNGIDTYTISATDFSASFSENNFDEVTYSFTGSDVFGNQQVDEITLSKVINFDGVSLVLSNESVTFPAKSNGEVIGGFDASSGSVQMFIGGNQIQHIDGLFGQKNAFDIISASGENVIPTDDTPNTSDYSISSMIADSGSLNLDIRYIAGDSSTSQSFQKVVTYTKAKKAAPNIEFQVSPSSQTIEANSLGSGSSEPQSLTVIAREGFDTKAFDISNITIFPIGSGLTATTSSFNQIDFQGNASSMSGDTTTISFTATAQNSEGTLISSSLSHTITKAKSAVPQTLITLTPQTQTITSSSLGGIDESNLQLINISISSGSVITDSEPSVGSKINNTTIDLSGTVTNSSGIIGDVAVTYTDEDGRTGLTQTLSYSVAVAVQGENGASGSNGEPGSTGPGIVFRGPYDNATSYQFDVSNGRRDSVLYNDIYYVTLQPTQGNPPTGTETDNLYWQSLGTQDFFVAAKIAIFEDSYIQNTLNVGTNNGGLGDSANITINGGTDNPYISINQSGTYGSQGYDVTGIFLGMDGGTEKLSIKSDADNYLRWTGAALEISGDLNLGGTTGDYIHKDGTFQLADGDLTYDGTTFNFSADLDLNSDGASDGAFSTQGIYLSKDGWISSKNFYIGSNGDANFRGNINATGGFVGGWEIGTNILYGDTVELDLRGLGRVATLGSGGGSVTLTGDQVIVNGGAYNITGFGSIFGDTWETIPSTTFTNRIWAKGGITSRGTVYVDDTDSLSIFTTGGISAAGSITAGGNVIAFSSSDKQLKNNIKPLTNSLDKIIKIGGYEFDWDETKQDDFKGNDVGIIAQEIQEVLPQVVTERKDGYLAVRYEKLVPLLIEGIKELAQKVEDLENEIFKLKGNK